MFVQSSFDLNSVENAGNALSRIITGQRLPFVGLRSALGAILHFAECFKTGMFKIGA
jgi:hypothetical protein